MASISIVEQRQAVVSYCRLCAKTHDKLVGIFDAEGFRQCVSSKIAKCLQIQILTNDFLPLAVCRNCLQVLNQCNEFYENSKQAQAFLQRLFVNSKNPQESIPKVCPNTVGNRENDSIVYIKEDYNYNEQEDENFDAEACDNYSNDAGVEDNYESYSDDYNNYSAKDRDCSLKHCGSKKRAKRKNKVDDRDIIEFIKEEKKGRKIPDNYMTGTDSDMEKLIRSESKSVASGCSKSSRKRMNGNASRYPWLCTDCNEKFPSIDSLEHHHERIHDQRSKYMCVQCCKVYDKYFGFLTHVKKHKNRPQFSCDDCGKSFVHKKVLEAHKAIHSDDRPFVCTTCGKAFRQQNALYNHSRSHLPDNMKNRYPCDQCDKRFSTKPNLVTHKRIHAGVRNFTCDQCGKSFIQKGNLESHFLTHSLEKPYSCTECHKSFKTSVQLKKHETVHTGAKPHQCAVCGRSFREKGTLREHQRIHTGAMPFTCEFCGKCFRFKGILTTHRRQHTGERPYSCIQCQHHFTNWPNYNKHMKRRHGINTSRAKNKDPLQTQQIVQNLHNLHDGIPTQLATTTVQVIQSAPHIAVLQTLNPSHTVTIPESSEMLPEMNSDTYRQRPTTYLSAPLTTYLQPYGFYSVSDTDHR